MKLIYSELEDIDVKVKYSLYLLKNKDNKWNEPKVIRTDEGWTIDTESFNIWRNNG